VSFKLVALGDVCTVKRGTTITQKSATHGEIPVVAGGLKPTYFHNVSNRDGNVITISGSGANAGFVNFWNDPIFASDCSTVEVERDDLSIHFVYYFLLSKQDFIYKELRSGAAQPHVYGKDIAKLEIPLPSLAKQQKIIARLGVIFAEIDKAEMAIEANVSNADTLFSQLVYEVENEIEGEAKELGDCVSLLSGFAFKSNEYSEDETDIPLLRGDNLNPKYIDFSDSKKFDKNKFNQYIKFSLRVNDIVLGMDRPLISSGLRIAKIEDKDVPSLLVQRVMRLRCNEGVDSDFIFTILNSSRFIKHLLGEQTGLGVPHISSKTISSFIIKIPHIDVQRQLVSKINSINESLNRYKLGRLKTLKSLVDLKKSILKQAFNGELVKD